MNKNTLVGLAAAACLMAITSVPAFADGSDAPTVTCKDGSTSTTTGKGACSHHGGVNKSAAAAAAAPAAATPAPAAAAPAAAAPAANAATPAPAATKPAATKAATTKAAPAATTTATAAGAPAGSTAKCKDGTYSKSKTHSGTCSKHGGVDTWLTS